MILMGNRSGSRDDIKIIDCKTRKDLRANGGRVKISNRAEAST